MFNKILIANRGEIACRITRTAQAMGFRVVAVYSEADADAPHVRLADEALCIGPAAAAESYLNIAAILHAAQRSGAEAIHPGYGFLSERADFAAACVAAGLVFIGPSAESIAAMGNKAAAKRRMLAAGVPCVPGYLGEQQDEASLLAQGLRLGFPLLVKALAGGGGRGMRTVHRAEDLSAALAGARREALSAFGDGELMLERLIEGGRHIEIQVFADRQGQTLHLGERDCTAQRRRQKVIEEAPSPTLGAAQRAAMGADAVAAARAVGYVGAGTVEFIVDAGGAHYFLEMNTRLQVEHPVTEMITGLDLVAWQLRVARGEPLPLSQAQIRFEGHAIEARLYAEDPYSLPQGFAPQTGRIRWWRPDLAAQQGLALRVDHGIAEQGQVLPHYDAMVAKLIVHGRDRAEALQRLRAGLAQVPLLGVINNGRFLRDLLADPEFVEARHSTSSLDEWSAAAKLQRPRPQAEHWLLAAGLLALANGPVGMRPASVASYALQLQWQAEGASEGRSLRVTASGRRAQLLLDGQAHQFESLGVDAQGRHCLQLDGRRMSVIAVLAGGAGSTPAQLWFSLDAAQWHFSEPSACPEPAGDGSDPARAVAPVAGVVAQLLVAPGDAVAQGQAMLSVEAMKMEMWLTAGCAGRVKVLHVQPRQTVAAGALLLELELDPPSVALADEDAKTEQGARP